MFPGKIFEQSSGNDDIVFFDFFWHIINTIYFNVTSWCILRNNILLTSFNTTLDWLNIHFFRMYAVKKDEY